MARLAAPKANIILRVANEVNCYRRTETRLVACQTLSKQLRQN